MSSEGAPHSPFPRSLPDEAKQWWDEDNTQTLADGLADPDPVTRMLYGIKAGLDPLGHPDYDVATFRFIHHLAFNLNAPDPSVAVLHIDDDLFLDVIWHGIYTIEKLEEKLERGEISATTLRPKNHPAGEERINEIRQALQEARELQEETGWGWG